MAQILVVDDENGPRQSLRMLLKEEYSVQLAGSVDEAIEVLANEPVDVIITDIRMPSRSGLDLLREVQQRHPDVQVIILTGYGQLDTAMEAIDGGAFAYLEKPFDHHVMLEKVRSCVLRHQQEQTRRAMEHLALEANRFETFGHLVTGTLHDLGTPLSVIGANLDILLENPQRVDLEKRLGTMQAQVKHCNDLVRMTMTLMRRSPESHDILDLNQIAEMCLEVARPFLTGHRVEPVLNLGTAAPMCLGDLVMVRQALLNLIYNAAQAMSHQDSDRRLCVQTWHEAGYVCIAVEDSGPGVPPSLRERIFDTLYTTKGRNGTGLGLTVVKNVMHRHGGEVLLEAGAEAGARFVLKFPDHA
jgi:signal transduction histidine kinase